MSKRILLLAGGLFCVASFFIFTLIVRSDVLRTVDFNLTVKIQDRLPQRAYYLFYLVTETARFEMMILSLIAVLAIIKKWRLLFFALVLFITGHVVEYIGKIFLDQPPPPFMFYKVPNNMNWFPATYSIEGNSYPSGHAMRAVFIAGLFIFVIRRNKRIPTYVRYAGYAALCGFAAAVCIGKIVLGQHWTTDVIAGSLIGAGILFIWLSQATKNT